jgi:creatinine amidohydrolase
VGSSFVPERRTRVVSRSHAIADLTWRELEAATDETSTLLLPVGSTEQHGHHLPLGVDTYVPEAIADRIAERSSCLVAPSIPYGVSPHHTFKPGTVTVGSETFRRYVRDVCRSAGEWGIENVLLLNGHYPVQDPELEIVVRDLRVESGIRAFHVSLVNLFEDVAGEIRESELSFHASEFETSLMLALFPDLVHMDRAKATTGPNDALPLTDYDALGENRVGWALTASEMDDLTPTGNLGDPTVASAETGERLVEEAVSRVVSLVEALEAKG